MCEEIKDAIKVKDLASILSKLNDESYIIFKMDCYCSSNVEEVIESTDFLDNEIVTLRL